MDPIAELILKNPDALLFEPRELYDPCIIGVASTHPDDWWGEERDPEAPPVAIYSYEKVVEAFLKEALEGTTRDEAMEYVDFNMAGAWAGNGTPIIVSSFEDDDDEL